MKAQSSNADKNQTA